jgi:hypothetical protein
LYKAVRRLWTVFAQSNLDPSTHNPKPPEWIDEALKRYEAARENEKRNVPVGHDNGADRMRPALRAVPSDSGKA